MSEYLTYPIPREALLYPHRTLLPRAWATLRELRKYRDLLRYLVTSSLQTENVGTVFGFLWWLLDPLLLMLVYVVLVTTIFHRSTPNFPIFLMCAMLPWEGFGESVNIGMATIIGKHTNMRQIAFPRAILPVASTATATIHVFVVLPFLLAGAWAYGYQPSLYFFYALPILAIEMTFALGFTFFVSALNVVFRDTQHILPPLMRMWFFLSPALYPLTNIPAAYRRYFLINPFAEIFGGYRNALLYHTFLDLKQTVYVVVVALGTLVLGYLAFISIEPSFAKID